MHFANHVSESEVSTQSEVASSDADSSDTSSLGDTIPPASIRKSALVKACDAVNESLARTNATKSVMDKPAPMVSYPSIAVGKPSQKVVGSSSAEESVPEIMQSAHQEAPPSIRASTPGMITIIQPLS